MDRDKIIQEIYHSELVDKVTSSFSSWLKNNKEDFVQEIYLMILQIPEDRLISLYTKGDLYFYIVRIMKNQCFYYKSVFNKKYNDDRILYYENLPECQDE